MRFLHAGRQRARVLRGRVRRGRRPPGAPASARSDRRDLRLADPQLYVNGELVGGADIVEEMDESGELATLLGVEQPERPAMSAKQELQADPQQSPPIQIQR